MNSAWARGVDERVHCSGNRLFVVVAGRAGQKVEDARDLALLPLQLSALGRNLGLLAPNDGKKVKPFHADVHVADEANDPTVGGLNDKVVALADHRGNVPRPRAHQAAAWAALARKSDLRKARLARGRRAPDAIARSWAHGAAARAALTLRGGLFQALLARDRRTPDAVARPRAH